MALLDRTSIFSNATIIAEWANGKYGVIRPTNKGTYIFEECEIRNGTTRDKYTEQKCPEKCPVLATGFVFTWLLHRIRKDARAMRLDFFAPKDRGKTPKEIYDIYIESRKKWFLDTIRKRPDVWKIPDLEKEFYEHNLTVAGEKDLILKSEPLLQYLDEEDKKEFFDVMKNFLGYVAHLVEPYQHTMEKKARQKRIENNTNTIKAILKRAEEETEKSKAEPKYTIDSPEILKFANKLSELQAEILNQLIENKCVIKDWRDNAILNQYSEKEMWDASIFMNDEGLAIAFFCDGLVSSHEITDVGKLVLRKYRQLMLRNESQKVPRPNKDKKPKTKRGTRKPNYNTPSYVCTPADKRNDRINTFAIAVQILGFTNKRENAKWFKFFSGETNRCNIEWQKGNASATYLIKELSSKSIIAMGKSTIASVVRNQLQCSAPDYRGVSKKDAESIMLLVEILDQTSDLSDFYKPGTDTIDENRINAAYWEIMNGNLSQTYHPVKQ